MCVSQLKNSNITSLPYQIIAIKDLLHIKENGGFFNLKYLIGFIEPYYMWSH